MEVIYTADHRPIRFLGGGFLWEVGGLLDRIGDEVLGGVLGG